MPNLHRMFEAKQAIVVHACATPYRERSHFDGQDVLESGLPKPAPATAAGSIARWLPCAPSGRVDPGGSKAFGVGPVTPLVVRGPAPVLSWAPQRVQPASADTVQRLLELYRHSDPKARRRARGQCQAERRSSRPAGWRQKPGGPGAGASARLFRRSRRHRGKIPGAAGRAARRRAGARRLGYPLQRRHRPGPPVAAPRRARRRARGGRNQHGTGVA